MCVCSAVWSFETAFSASSWTVCVCECVYVCFRPSSPSSGRRESNRLLEMKEETFHLDQGRSLNSALGFLNGREESTGAGNYRTVFCERVDDTLLKR